MTRNRKPRHMESAVPENDETPAVPDAAGLEPDAAPDPAAAPAVEVVVPRADYDKVLNQKIEIEDRLMRTAADYDNYRKRVLNDKKLWEIAVYKKVLQDILAVYQSVSRGLAAADGSADGLEAIKSQIDSILDSHGVVPIAAEGQPFDPEKHEALFMEDNGQVPDRTVLAQIEAGYMYGEAVLVPAKVKVSRAPAVTENREQTTEDSQKTEASAAVETDETESGNCMPSPEAPGNG